MNNVTHYKQRPTFIEGVVLALVASLAVSISVSVFDWVLPLGLLARVLISVAGFAYLLYLFSHCREKVGRMTVLSIYVVMVMALWVFMPALQWVVIAHLGLIWLVRSLYFYSSVISALLDLGLTALSIVSAVAAYLHTGSLFLGLWSLFLVQALFVWIPADWHRRATSSQHNAPTDRFQVAHQVAENAIRKLATNASTY